MNIQTELHNILQKRVLVLDGAMGTMLQKLNLTEEDFRGSLFYSSVKELKGCNDVLSVSKPEVIKDIHKQYLLAGADIIETNTFNSNRISLKEYALENYTYQLNYASAKLAVDTIAEFNSEFPGSRRFVAGSIGPTSKMLSMSPDMNNPAFREVYYDEMVEIYYEQVSALIDGGVDILLVETIFDTLNAKAALYAIEKRLGETGRKLPVMLSVTISDSGGRLLSGQKIDAFLISISHADIFSVGFNCALGAEGMTSYLTGISSKVPYYLSAYPNAGLPNILGGYDESAEEFAAIAAKWCKRGIINIIGGCCGTTPEHITLLRSLSENAVVRKLPELHRQSELSGLEPVFIGKENNFINIGERTNVAGSRKFARLIREKKYEEALSVAREQAEAGASVLDVSMDDAMLDARTEMVTFLLMLSSDPEISRLAVMIDSSKWEVIEAGLKCLQGKSIVNSISLKEGENVFLERAEKIRKYGAAVVVMAFDETGQATDFEHKISICVRAYKILTEKAGFAPQDIYFDVNILTISTGIEEHNNYAVDFINSVKWIKENLPGVCTSGGISNLSFAFRGNDTIRKAMHSVFLYHAINAGLDMGIVNAGELPLYDDIENELRTLAENVILNKYPDASEKLISYAEKTKDLRSEEVIAEVWRNDTVENRLKHAIVKGLTAYIEEDINECLKKYNKALDIIEKPLMDGMNYVGDLFGKGKMFLPQVIKSARVMKNAVSFLMPHIEKENKLTGAKSFKGTVLLATVKGDVHDIGKNITGLVLSCNNYRVIDIGVMAPANLIITEALKHKVDVIGLSGLISPSLDEMIRVAEEMELAGMKIPLVIGGATTSKIHTAIKIAPAYSGPVVHVSDAGEAPGVISDFISEEKKEIVAKETEFQYSKIRDAHYDRIAEKQYISLEEARKNKFQSKNNLLHEPKFKGVNVFSVEDLSVLVDYVNWEGFLNTWKMNRSVEITDVEFEKQKEIILSDARIMLDKIVSEKLTSAKGVFGIFPALALGDDVLVYDEKHNKDIATLHFLRNQEKKNQGEKNLCLSDFVDNSYGKGFIGVFALTAGLGADKYYSSLIAENDVYNALIFRIIVDRLAEAFSEYLHYKVKTKYWGSQNETADIIMQNKYEGIRVSPGYSSCPDHSEKTTIFNLLNARIKTGISLTENYSMVPVASVCGYYFANPEARYFNVGRLQDDQLEDYSVRKGIAKEKLIKWIARI